MFPANSPSLYRHCSNWAIIQLVCLLVAVLLLSSCIPSFNRKPTLLTDKKSDPVKSIGINVTTQFGDKQTFTSGDEVSFLISIDQNAYVLLLYEDASGLLWQLLPNDYHEKTLFRTGDFLPIPEPEVPYRFKVSAPFGKETLWAFASNKPFPLLHSTLAQNGMRSINMDMKSILQRLINHKQTKMNLFGQAKLSITTKK